MPDRLFVKIFAAASLVLGGLLLPVPAWAGFEWVSPLSGGASSSSAASGMSLAPAVPATPITAAPLSSRVSSRATSNPEVIVPVIITGDAQASVPEARGNDAVVRGFAKSVPLAVALRQILPSGYSFAVDKNVDTGVLVSFQGGRPWRETLRDALAPAGLVTHERGQTLAIGYSGATLVSGGSAKISTPSVVTYAPGAGPTMILPAVSAPMIRASAAPGISQIPAARSLTGAGGQWTAGRGESLHQVLESWCHRSNVEFDWLAEYDYPLEASVSFNGTFEQAVRALLAGFENAHPQPVAELHTNPAMGQKVLVVQTRGNTSSD